MAQVTMVDRAALINMILYFSLLVSLLAWMIINKYSRNYSSLNHQHHQNMLEMQSLGSHLTSTNSESLEDRSLESLL